MVAGNLLMRSQYNMNRRKKSKFGLFVVIAFLLYFAYTAVGQQKLLYEKGLEVEKIQEKVKQETLVNKELNKQKEMINSDEYIEKVAREKLGMVKKGERVFVDVGE